ncbi:MAG TPA: hypothetical protein VKJ45_13225, partial [Blastocatellia bacterium]|nr:hypothetical protein [Blastocatellia bacterium]
MNTKPVIFPQLPSGQLLTRLPDLVVAQCLGGCLGQLQGAARPLGLGVATAAHRAPDGNRRGIKIDMIPAQRPSLLGTDAGQQAEHDIGAEPGVLGGLEQGRGLFGGQRAAG